ncbi:MAG: YggT family protein [Candidatus Abawacabacteria bacterium]|nr:YggT family protein [Candidatus Abawacabacteria bacterium]
MATFIAFLIIFVSRLEAIISFLVLLRILLSWFPNIRANFLVKIVVDVTQPLFALVYRFFPSLRRNTIDFSPIIVFLGIQIIRDIIVYLLSQLLIKVA